TDGGGSIRIPASFCGVFGLKPTFGLVPSLPGFGGWKTLSHVGPIARSVRDAALMLDVVAGPDEIDRTSIPRGTSSYLRAVARPRVGLRLGYSPDLGFAAVEAAVAGVVEGALGAFETLGHLVDRVALDLGAARPIFEIVVGAENAGAHRTELENHRALMDEGLVKFIERGLGVSAVEYVAAVARRDELAAALAAHFARYDLLLTPAVAVAPFPVGQAPKDPLDWIPFTYPFNLTGNPAASVPAGRTSDGLPVGLQVVGPRHEDGLVLNLAAQFEEAHPWAHLRPPEP
ncbi:MAG: amidase, partial [Acidobacteria bacterium]